ncbi:hypothetical protein VWZ88_01090 [Phaeobacter sp. JH20_36]|uniref:hypothetical protein n=1 Tax=unclassified Phaeobacter TaxID=2621772 RepID=UPI003A89D4F5
MAELQQKFNWIRAVSIVSIIALFIADFAFNIMAKDPPLWAYVVPGLLALGVEANAVGRLLMQLVRAAARVPQEDKEL